MNNSAKDNITIVKEQISNFDNKASILIAIVSVVFTLSLSILDYVRAIQTTLPEKLARYVILLTLFCLYCLVFSLEIIFLVLVIYPRKDKSPKSKSSHYYRHLANMSAEEVASALAENSEQSDIEQLQTTARICTKKHKFIVCSIWMLIPLFVLLFAMCFAVIF